MLLKLGLVLALVAFVLRMMRTRRELREAGPSEPRARRAIRLLSVMKLEIAIAGALVLCSAAAIALSTGPHVSAWAALAILAAAFVVSIVIGLW